MPGKLDQLLSRVVERKGYQVQGADAEALFARKGDDALLAAWKTDGPVSLDEAQIFLSAMEQVHAASGILVATKGLDASAKDALAGSKVEVWAESRLVVEVGEAYVKDALEAPAATALPPTPQPAASGARQPTRFPSLIAQGASAANGGPTNAGVAYFMPNKKKEQPHDMRAAIPQGRGGALGYAWGGAGASIGGGMTNAGIATTLPSKPRIKTDQWGNVVRPGAATAAAPAATPVPAAPTSRVVDADEEAYEIIVTPKKKERAAPAMKDVSPPACTTLKLTVTKDDAVAKTGKPGTAKLALVPHVAFEYNVEMSRPGMPAPVTGKGALLINSLTGELRQVDALTYDDAEPADARKDAEKMTAVDVYDKVKSYMAKTFSRTMNVEKELAGNTVMSTLKVTPDPDEMNLEHKGIVHLPVWEVTGSTGVTKIDAYTGATF